MTPEEAIYGVISAVTPNIYPTNPEPNTALPFVVYTVIGAEPVRNLGGLASLVRYTVQIESWATTSADANALLAGVRNALDGYQGGQIQRAMWDSQDTQQAEDGYHGVAVFTVFMNAANVVPAVGPNAVIRTTANGIELEACNHRLTLDCDGLELDGGPVVDLTNYARKDTANTFATDQTVNGKLNLQDNASTRRGELSYNDPAGAYRFGRSDHTNTFAVAVNSNNTRMSGDGAYLVSGGTATVTGFEGGGQSTVDLNRRPTDNSTGVGGTVRCWTRTGQTQNALEVLAPGGGSSTWAVTSNGGIRPASMSNAAAANGTIYFSTDAARLVFKDNAGTVNALY